MELLSKIILSLFLFLPLVRSSEQPNRFKHEFIVHSVGIPSGGSWVKKAEKLWHTGEKAACLSFLHHTFTSFENSRDLTSLAEIAAFLEKLHAQVIPEKDFQKEISAYDDSETLMKVKAERPEVIPVSLLYLNIARSLYSFDQFQWADECFQKALEAERYHTALKKGTRQYALLHPDVYISILSFQADCLFGKSQKEGNLNDLKRSVQVYHQVSDLTDSVSLNYLVDFSRRMLYEAHTGIYSHALQACFIGYNTYRDDWFVDQGLFFMEKSKQKFIFQQYAEQYATQGNKQITENLKMEALLKGKIDSIGYYYAASTFLSASTDSVSRRKVENELDSIWNLYEELVLHTRKFYPQYDRIRKDLEVVSLRLVQQKLSNNQALIEYCLPDSSLVRDPVYRIIISKSSAVLDRILPSDSLGNLTSQFRREVACPGGLKGYAHYCRMAKRLFDLLLGPTSTLNKITHLIISPDDLLYTIPFDALLTDVPRGEGESY